MNGFLQFCVNVPNIGTLAFFLVFVLAIPTYLISAEQYDTLKYYLLVVHPIISIHFTKPIRKHWVPGYLRTLLI
jgi:hypothetical protein